MRLLLALLFVDVLVGTAAVIPKSQLVNQTVNEKWNELAKSNTFNYAFDVVSSVSQSTFSCLNSNGYSLAFLRIYGPSSGGQVDATGVNNVFAASNAGLLYEVFVTPSPTSAKSALTQLSEAINYAQSQGLQLTRVWLQVTWPISWSPNTYSNVQFIQSFINAGSTYGVQVGVFTNWYDWAGITGSSTAVSPPALWYWNANGLGSSAESTRDATDFFSFGPFRSANVKQYGLGETVCRTNVNVNIFNANGLSGFNSIDLDARKLESQ